MDAVSGKGFSYGYLGGGLNFAIALGLVAGHSKIGISQAQAVRIGILGAGLWWAGFTLFAAKNLFETPSANALPERYKNRRFLPAAYAAVGVSQLMRTAKRVRRFRYLLLFLVAYTLYNDGIQTVINMATIYGKYVRSTRKVRWHKKSGYDSSCALVSSCAICVFHNYGCTVFCRRRYGWNCFGRVSGSEPLFLWFNDPRRGKC